MYTACMFCHKPLGANDVIEHFPVGRRLAFDAAKGRLWVVCRACERWNLTPLEIRWEAVEECESSFRETRLRVSTDNIGLARLTEGLELVRIGAPQRPEFAAWRYGDQFGRRRRRTIMIGGGLVLVSGAVMAGAAAAGIGVGALGGLWGNIPNIMNSRRTVQIKTDDGRILKIRGHSLIGAELEEGPDHSLSVIVKHEGPRSEVFSGDEALRIARTLVPAINSRGGSARTVREAVQELEQSGSPEAFVASAVRANFQSLPKERKPISKWPAATRLALEMALHEDAERRAIEGELTVLEAAWREAEEIAEIADNMFMPADVEKKLAKMKEKPLSALTEVSRAPCLVCMEPLLRRPPR